MKDLLRAFVFTATALFSSAGQTQALTDRVFESEGQKFKVEILHQAGGVVWGFDFLNPTRMIFTERTGALKTLDITSKKTTEIKGAPKVWVEGQGGLLDVRVHPKDADRIYLTYSEAVSDGGTTAFASAKLSDQELKEFKKILSAHAANDNEIHFGSRIEFDGAGHVFVTVGDRNERKLAQDLGYHNGKVLRFHEDGTVPKDNPFVGKKDAKPEIWSLGHRSPQGLVKNPLSNELWLAEMGPRGGDEINLIQPGLNYGWPDVTFGKEYWGPKIGVSEKKGFEQPVVHWVPSISPSGITIYQGDRFPKWKGNLFVGNLSGMHLRRLSMNGRKVENQEVLLADLGLRIRNVRPGKDGLLYFSTDDGRIARLTPQP